MPWTKAGNIRGPEGPAVPLDGLTDVTAPANTVAGKLLGTTATGQWGPVDAPTTGWGKWSGTQAQYDALPIKDPNVLYVITG